MLFRHFEKVSTTEDNPKWIHCISREKTLYKRENDMRSDFARDYNRILHSLAYRRLKHKTQVFFATKNDHICTRMEHVNHVASVSSTISKYLGLNTELTTAIALGHDLGHAPFGHEGERILKKIMEKQSILGKFWHEKNSLWFVDSIETLLDPNGMHQNLGLTYAVRDGIVSHCGEVIEEAIVPRDEPIDLKSIENPSQFCPFTWEACVVKISDKISYLGRDIEDALMLKILKPSQIRLLRKIIHESIGVEMSIRDINNTVLMHDFIVSLCEASSPEAGIRFPVKYLHLMNAVKDFNYKYIYHHPRLNSFKKYSELVLESVFYGLLVYYKGKDTLIELNKQEKMYPILIGTFKDWLVKYSDVDLLGRRRARYKNDIIYKIESSEDYQRALIDYISGMTDSFAIRVFNESTTF